MSALLLQLYNELGALLGQAPVQQQPPAQQQAFIPPQQQQQQQQFAPPQQQQQFAPPQQQPGYPPATQEMIVALVTPLVENPNIKAALQQQMQQMGINALPEAQPHQYPELYARFQQVAAQFQQPPQQQPMQQQPMAGGGII